MTIPYVRKKWGMQSICLFLISSILVGCSSAKEQVVVDTSKASWQEITGAAKGSTVSMMMWVGDPLINRYMHTYVVPSVKERFNIDLEISAGQGGDIVSYAVTQGQTARLGEIDMVWINGETFYQLRQLNALHGPFTDKLPNSRFVHWENPFIGIDFQQPVEGYEAPWGNVQLSLIYNSDKVQNPPVNAMDLANFVKSNPGKFTIGTEFTGLTFLNSLFIDLAGGMEAVSGDFDAMLYETYSAELWEYINEIKPYFWKQGETFPETVAQMHQMFANTELWFSMSNNDSEVDNKVMQGLFPKSAKAYVLTSGTIQNSHYLGVLETGGNKAGAMTVINFMMSPEAQYKKMQPDVWGDGTILAMDKLPEDWKRKFENIPSRVRGLKRSDIQDKALMEIAPEYMIRLNDDFRKFVIEN